MLEAFNDLIGRVNSVEICIIYYVLNYLPAVKSFPNMNQLHSGRICHKQCLRHLSLTFFQPFLTKHSLN